MPRLTPLLPPSTDRGPMARILIVDDEKVIQTVFAMVLQGPDRVIVTAGSRDEALARLRETGPVDVALVDKNIGTDSGIDVARDIKAQTPNTEVILITAYASLDSAIDAVKIGVYDYITKPLEDNEVLRLKVQNALDKVQLKTRLEESQARYRRVFDASADAMFLCDEATGAIEEVNPAALYLYGYNIDELRRLKLSNLERAGGPDAPFHYHGKKDGTLFAVDISSSRLELGSRALRLFSIRDLSDQQRQHFERQQIEGHLRQSQKMEAIGRLAGGVAHDFNNVLVAILCHADFGLQHVDDTSPIKEHLDQIIAAAERAAGLTRRLLTFSRHKPLAPEPMQINDIIADMQKLLRKTLGEDVELTTALAGDLWLVQADSDQISQVVLNLVVNARDAMPEGGRIVIETANVVLEERTAMSNAGVEPGSYVRMAVSDTGVGIAPDIQARIFEPFFTTKEAGRGTGLGLSTVYGIVRQANGNITVYSEPGDGTSFRVYLPRSLPNAVLTRRVPPVLPARPLGKGETVLVVEDDDLVCALLRRVLAQNGYNAVMAHDGAEALEVAAAHAGVIDLLLTDVVMPKVSGKELAEKLRALRPTIKIVFMSGYTEQAVLVRGVLESGMAFIEKPFTQELLLARLRQVLDAAN
jgi:two-component system, cell cycle sensor histidine kinase and response regulator CckA